MIENNDFMMQEVHSEPDVISSYSYIDNVWVRMMQYPKTGDKNHPHKHTRDHATLLAKGSIKCTVNGEETFFKAPTMIMIHKDHIHQFEALEDDTLMFCVHGIRETDGYGQLVSPDMIPKGLPAYDMAKYFEPFAPPPEPLEH